LSDKDKLQLIEVNSKISISRQCELLSLSRSTYYYQPKGESPRNLELMSIIDKLYIQHPEYGYPMMTEALRRRGHNVNEKRISRLMRLMNIQSVLPKPNTSKPNKEHKKYPYLLRNRIIRRPQEVWATDITYIPMEKGFLYLTVVMDWYSRFILSWELSNCMDTSFCIQVFESALKWGAPAIFNTDQGSQYTSPVFTSRIEKEAILVSMDGKGRALDNVFVERLWRTIKYEYVYLYSFEDGHQLYKGLEEYIRYYNYDRPHSSFGGKTPAEVYLKYLND
jgi:putative transposase